MKKTSKLFKILFLIVLVIITGGCSNTKKPNLDKIMSIGFDEYSEFIEEIVKSSLVDYKEFDLNRIVVSEDATLLKTDTHEKMLDNIAIDVYIDINPEAMADKDINLKELGKSFFEKFHENMGVTSINMVRIKTINLIFPLEELNEAINYGQGNPDYNALSLVQDDLISKLDLDIYTIFKGNLDDTLKEGSEYLIERMGKEKGEDTFIILTRIFAYDLEKGEDFAGLMEKNSSEVMSAITDSDIIANLKSINIDKVRFVYYATWYQGKEPMIHEYLI